MMLTKQAEGFLATPPLWKGNQFGITQFEFPHVDLGNFQPADIPENIRLGHQMEHIFEQLVRHEGSYEIIMQNQAIRSGKTTIGELDFILRHVKTEITVHVELTYKFYVIDPSISEPIHRLMGPNRRDMFFTKMEKIKNAQFSLVHTAESKEILEAYHINPNQIKQQCCFKAQLFKPYHSTFHIRPLNTEAVVGHWMRFVTFEQADFNAYMFYIPYKKEWPIIPHEDVSWSSFRETLLEVNLRMIQKNAPMLWMRKSDADFEKFFVVWW